MGLEMKIQLSDTGQALPLAVIPLSTTFMRLMDVIWNRLDTSAREVFSLREMGKGRAYARDQVVLALEKVLDQLCNKSNTMSYYVSDDLESGYGSGMNRAIDGRYVALDGGLGECWLRFRAMDKHPEGKEWDEEIDIRERDYVDTDQGRVYIVKKPARKMVEAKLFLSALDVLRQIEGNPQLAVVIG